MPGPANFGDPEVNAAYQRVVEAVRRVEAERRVNPPQGVQALPPGFPEPPGDARIDEARPRPINWFDPPPRNLRVRLPNDFQVPAPNWGQVDQPQEIRDDMPRAKKEATPFYNIPIAKYLQLSSSKLQEGEVGLEIECEGNNLFATPLSYWTVHQDNSLRISKDGHPPLEYVLKKPLPRKEIPLALDYLVSKLAGAKSEVHNSHRSSVHVHVNCQKMTIKEAFTYVCLYLIFEDALVKFSGPDRAGNLFCLRAKDAQFWIYSIVQGFRNGRFQEALHETYRYTACNTASIAKFGSLEFRSMRGTVDKDVIQSWVDLLLFLKDKSLEFSDPLKLYEKYISCNSPEDFFDLIFTSVPKLGRLLSGTADLSRGMEEGSIFVRDIAYSLEEWKVKPKGGVKYDPKPDKILTGLVSSRRDRLTLARRRNMRVTNSLPGFTVLEVMGTRYGVSGRSSVWYDEFGAIATTDRDDDVTEWHARR